MAGTKTDDAPKGSFDAYYTPRHVDDGSDRSLSSKANLRSQLESDMEQFLSGGGTVEEVKANVTADPPRRPVSNYGSRPI